MTIPIVTVRSSRNMLISSALLSIFILPSVFSSTLQQNTENVPKTYFVHPKDSLTPRIIGGQDVTRNEYPFQVALMIFISSTSYYFCGGSLISNQWVLTAAHCLNVKPIYIWVLLGSYDLNDSTSLVVMNTTQSKYHKGYSDDTYQNDIGLVRLPRNVTFSNSIQPVKLANGTNSYANVNGTVLGWGRTSNVAQDLPTILKMLNTTIMSNSDCASASAEYGQIIKSTHICTSGAGRVGSCNGDSGGPLLVDGEQVGIVSFGVENCELGMPSVYTRITDYSDWILENAVDGAESNVKVQLAVKILTAMGFLYFFKMI